MLHANVCKVNYATRAGETVVKKLLEITQSVIPLVSQRHIILTKASALCYNSKK